MLINLQLDTPGFDPALNSVVTQPLTSYNLNIMLTYLDMYNSSVDKSVIKPNSKILAGFISDLKVQGLDSDDSDDDLNLTLPTYKFDVTVLYMDGDDFVLTSGDGTYNINDNELELEIDEILVDDLTDIIEENIQLMLINTQ